MSATVYLAAGCFWGVEDAFQRVEGVLSTTVGYTGGILPDPTYRQVCTGMSGHAETVRVDYDPHVVTRDHLAEVFWKIHDPTQKDRQGHDVGTQYRSAIFVHNEDEDYWARQSVQAITDRKEFTLPIMTRIEKLNVFYPAEDVHQDYLRKNPHGYCHIPQRVLQKIGEPQKI